MYRDASIPIPILGLELVELTGIGASLVQCHSIVNFLAFSLFKF
jgi:hypothetical protein